MIEKILFVAASVFVAGLLLAAAYAIARFVERSEMEGDAAYLLMIATGGLVILGGLVLISLCFVLFGEFFMLADKIFFGGGGNA